MINGEEVFINGDGETSRDFCFIENVVQINLLAATADAHVKNEIYNVAVGGRTSLNKLFHVIRSALSEEKVNYSKKPVYLEFRGGDVRHSQADIGKATKCLGYKPQYEVHAGIACAMSWYVSHLK